MRREREGLQVPSFIKVFVDPMHQITLWGFEVYPLRLPVVGRTLHASNKNINRFSRTSPNGVLHRVVILNLAALVSIS